MIRRPWIGGVLLVSAMLWAPPSMAGGPLLVCNPSAGTPFVMAPGVRPVFADLGSLGVLSKPQADALLADSLLQWSSVATSTFEARLAGDLTVDVTASNLSDVIAVRAGHGGIDVVYDDDGGIFDALGAPPGVIGVASPEWVDPSSCEIAESWMILNGPRVRPDDPEGRAFQGVLTHEIGHALGLAHSQTNGAIIVFEDGPGPEGCTAPYGGSPLDAHIETMYPFIDLRPDGFGDQMATVDRLDDRAALSDLYPAPGWPSAFPSIEGVMRSGDGVTPLTGINLVARNIADPFGDAIGVLSGNATQGFAGPDGRFAFSGLTPGAEYVVYLERIVAGGFRTPLGPLFEEEYWNGAREGSDPSVDDRCEWTSVSAPRAGVDPVLNIPFDPDEPNDDLTDPTQTPCGVRLDRLIYPLGDVDSYELEVATESFVQLDVDAAESGSTLDAVLGVFGEDLSPLALVDDRPAPGEEAGFDPYLLERLEAGRYVVAVAAFGDVDFDGDDASSVGDYELDVRCSSIQPAPGGGALLATTGAFESLIEVEPSSGVGWFRAPHGGLGRVTDLAILEDGTLVAGSDASVLLTLDPSTGETRVLGSHGPGTVLTAIEWVEGELLGVLLEEASGGSSLVIVHVETDEPRRGPSEIPLLELETIGAIGLVGGEQIRGLAWDAASRTLYGVTGPSSSRLLILDPSSGSSGSVGDTGFADLGGLARDTRGRLYSGVGGSGGVDAGSLVRIDAGNGNGTLIGATGFGGISGLAFVPGRGIPAPIPAAGWPSRLGLGLLLSLAAVYLFRVRD